MYNKSKSLFLSISYLFFYIGIIYNYILEFYFLNCCLYNFKAYRVNDFIVFVNLDVLINKMSITGIQN